MIIFLEIYLEFLKNQEEHERQVDIFYKQINSKNIINKYLEESKNMIYKNLSIDNLQ